MPVLDGTTLRDSGPRRCAPAPGRRAALRRNKKARRSAGLSLGSASALTSGDAFSSPCACPGGISHRRAGRAGHVGAAKAIGRRIAVGAIARIGVDAMGPVIAVRAAGLVPAIVMSAPTMPAVVLAAAMVLPAVLAAFFRLVDLGGRGDLVGAGRLGCASEPEGERRRERGGRQNAFHASYSLESRFWSGE